MKELVYWLANIEGFASETYERASKFYVDDAELKEFLENSAEEEAWHRDLMKNADDYLQTVDSLPPVLTVDEQTDKKIKRNFEVINKGVEEQNLTKRELFKQIVEAEFSEWNDIFLYVIDALKKSQSNFAGQAAKMQSHIHGIKYFLESQENGHEMLQRIEAIQPVWTENILIVDDDEAVAKLIKALLNRTGNIDIAHNGLEALSLIEKKYYRLIISDIDMPVMDGIALYENVSTNYPKSKNKFLFITGDISPEKLVYFNDRQLKCLQKPMRIKELREEAYSILANP